MTNDGHYGNESETPDKKATGRQLDMELAREQGNALADQLQEEGRELAGSVVLALLSQVRWQGQELADAREELEELRAGAKTSRGRERASAAAPAGKGPRMAPACKHDFGADGVCKKVGALGPCGVKRQRAARKPKQTSIPGTSGGAAASGAGA